MEREYIHYKDIKKEYQDDYFVMVLVSYHNVLAHTERQYDRNGEYDEEDGKEIDYLERMMLDWAMYIENSKDEKYATLKGKLIKNCLHDHVYVDERLDAILRPLRRKGAYTGTGDKNGTPIYVNDVVKTKYGRVCRVTHFISERENCFDLEPYDNLNCPPGDEADLWKPMNLEVVNDEYPYEKLEDNKQ